MLVEVTGSMTCSTGSDNNSMASSSLEAPLARTRNALHHSGLPSGATAEVDDFDANLAKERMRHATSGLHGLTEDFNYIKSMRRTREVMRETVLGWRGGKARPEDGLGRRTAGSIPDRASRPRRAECALCTKDFPAGSLPGKIPFNAVADWRRRRGGQSLPLMRSITCRLAFH